MAIQEVAFYQDDGHRLAADLVTAGRAGVPAGAVVICPGFLGTRRGGAGLVLADHLASELGWAVLLLDYSGFGGSEGPPRRFEPERQVGDVRSGVAYLRARYPESPVSIFGNSFGAGIAVAAAARMPAVAGLFSLCAFSSGRALMAERRAAWQLVELDEALAADRAARVLSGQSRLVDPDTIMIRDPEAAAYMARLVASGNIQRSRMPLVDAQRLVDFEPIAEAPRLRGRPALFVHCEHDHFITAQHSAALAEAAGAPYVPLPYGHYDVYEGEPRQRLLRLAVDFFRTAASGR